MLSYSPRNSRNLKPGAVPTVNLPGSVVNRRKRQMIGDDDRSHRLEKRLRQKNVTEILRSASQANNEHSNPSSTNANVPETTCQADLEM